MIAHLKGQLAQTGDGEAVIDVGGVGYLLFCSRRTLDRLGAPGQAVAVAVETHVREDHIHLYGFADPAERAWFRLLTTVQGVGPRVALAILSVMDPDGLTLALAAQDKAPLVRADGVGPKLAVRILSELKDKAGRIGLPAGGTPAGSGTAPAATGGSSPQGRLAALREDAISALVNLGYGRAEAFTAVGATLATLGDETTVEAIIPLALKELST